MVVQTVCRDADDLYVPRLEIFGTTGNLTKLGRADGREITWVREQDTLYSTSVY
jgi:hypothetical protein